MAPRFLALGSRTHSRRRRAHVLGLTSLPGLECLEQRTLLSASLALYNGNYAGTYKGQSVVDNNGTTTKSTVTATAVQATITNGAITLTIPGGTGIGTVTTNGSISGTVSAQIQGGTVPISFVGKVTSVNAAGIAASGTWSYADTVNGVEVSGKGTWTAESAPVLTDFDADYTGTYKGSTITTTNGKHTKSTVAATSFQSVISDGAITTTFPAGSLLTSGTGTIAANGAITGTTSFQEDGVTVTVTFNGSATRSLTGVRASGTWSFSVNLGGGSTETGTGTWSAQSVVSYNGSFAGQFSGTETVDDVRDRTSVHRKQQHIGDDLQRHAQPDDPGRCRPRFERRGNRHGNGRRERQHHRHGQSDHSQLRRSCGDGPLYRHRDTDAERRSVDQRHVDLLRRSRHDDGRHVQCQRQLRVGEHAGGRLNRVPS
jgi:hypothetical protein